MSARIRPKKGEVLLYMDLPESESEGGILIPETAQDRSQTGEVRRLGIWDMDENGRLIPFPVQVGDKVIVNKRVGRWMHSERERLKLVPADRILAVISETPAD